MVLVCARMCFISTEALYIGHGDLMPISGLGFRQVKLNLSCAGSFPTALSIARSTKSHVEVLPLLSLMIMYTGCITMDVFCEALLAKVSVLPFQFSGHIQGKKTLRIQTTPHWEQR